MSQQNKKMDGTELEDISFDRLVEQYLADPQSLSLEEQLEIYQHFLDRMRESGNPEAKKFAHAIEAVNRILQGAQKGDPAYMITSHGTYRKQENDMRFVPVSQLIPDTQNLDLFRDIEGEDFEQLKCSIQELGLIQPIIVTPELRVICGRQRLRAAKAIGLESVPVVVRWIGEQEKRAAMAIEENIRRRQLQPSEMARAIKKLIELKQQKQKVDQVAQEIGLSRSQVYLYRGLDCLIPEFSSLLDGRKLTQQVALQIAQLDETVQRELYEALGERITKVMEKEKAVEFETIHAGLLKDLDGLSAEAKKLRSREAELKVRLNDLQDRLDRAEFKVGDELKEKMLLEEELQKTRAAMYQKVQEKQRLIDKLSKSMGPKVVPPPDYQLLKSENAKLKATLKELQFSPEAMISEIHEMMTTRLLTMDLGALDGKIPQKAKEQLKTLIPRIETWAAHLKKLAYEPTQEKKT